jgi:hypothetical protein
LYFPNFGVVEELPTHHRQIMLLLACQAIPLSSHRIAAQARSLTSRLRIEGTL